MRSMLVPTTLSLPSLPLLMLYPRLLKDTFGFIFAMV